LMYLLRVLDGASPSRGRDGPAGNGARRPIRAAGAAGLVLVVVAYTDYYYLVYCLAAAAILTAWRIGRGRPAISRVSPTTVPERVVLALAALILAVLVAIATTGGFQVRIGSLLISLRSPTNLLSMLWGLGIAWLLVRYRVAIRCHLDRTEARSALRW